MYIVVAFEFARSLEQIDASRNVLETRANALRCSTPAPSGAKSAKIKSTGFLSTELKSIGFSNLKKALSELFNDIKKDNTSKKTVLFSPAAASFDSFKNFEERGEYFNELIKRYKNAK